MFQKFSLTCLRDVTLKGCPHPLCAFLVCLCLHSPAFADCVHDQHEEVVPIENQVAQTPAGMSENQGPYWWLLGGVFVLPIIPVAHFWWSQKAMTLPNLLPKTRMVGNPLPLPAPRSTSNWSAVGQASLGSHRIRGRGISRVARTGSSSKGTMCFRKRKRLALS